MGDVGQPEAIRDWIDAAEGSQSRAESGPVQAEEVTKTEPRRRVSQPVGRACKDVGSRQETWVNANFK